MSDRPTSEARLQALVRAWKGEFRRASVAFLLALVVVALCVAAHLGRQGTPLTRLAAVCVVLVAVGILRWRRYASERHFDSAPSTLQRVLGPFNPELAARAARAARLAQQAALGQLQGAPELAQLHYGRLLASAPPEGVQAMAHQEARRQTRWAWVLLGLGVLSIALAPLRIVEGLNVLVAQDGRAPFGWPWIERERVIATAPAYLKQGTGLLGFETQAVLPQGTEIVVRGRALWADRPLTLTDGQRGVPFTDDGKGGLVAHWTVTDSASLRVGSRYGEVLITEPRELQVHAVQDAAPEVTLHGAPKHVKMAELERLEIRWSARDQYGLRQVDLLLRSGDRQERRNLAQFTGAATVEQGAYTLFARDTFLRAAFLPVEVSVAARDANTLDAAEWGESKIITLELPGTGELEAQRMQALERGRQALTRLFVWHEQASSVPSALSQTEAQQGLREQLQAAHAAFDPLLHGKESANIPRGLQAFIQGQLDRLEGTSRAGRSALDATTGVLLGFDAALGSLATRDAQAVAKRLSEVADQAARAARAARETEQRVASLDRLSQALDALEFGANQLSQLGELGRDLGMVTRAGLARISRARGNEDLFHTELASLHLAARLRRPTPSYSSAGGSGGVESGGGQTGHGQGPASDADQEFDQMAQQLQQLAQEHGDLMDRVGEVLRDAKSGVDTSTWKQEALQRAEALRREAAGLPAPGSAAGTSAADAALGREHVRGMAHALENLDLEQAVESGERAKQVLSEAQRRAAEFGLQEAIQQALTELEAQLSWARQQYDQVQDQAQSSARSSLSGSAEIEGELSSRAEQILKNSKGSEAALPEKLQERLGQAKNLMRSAAEALSTGDGDRAHALQNQAQRLLEQSDPGQTASNEGDDSGSVGEGKETGTKAESGGDVPNPEATEGPQEFRRRVLEGLAPGRGGRLGSAIQRYAEGLLN